METTRSVCPDEVPAAERSVSGSSDDISGELYRKPVQGSRSRRLQTATLMVYRCWCRSMRLWYHVWPQLFHAMDLGRRHLERVYATDG